MDSFAELNLNKPLRNAIEELGFEQPTPIQAEAFSVVRSGRDLVGVAQTGTGKTMAYLLPILQDLKYSKQIHPVILILVPTRELVLQVVDNIEDLTKYSTIRTVGVYGGTNMNTQKQKVSMGCDILVATPGRLQDLALTNVLRLKTVKKLVIDEVDVMLDLGFRPQLLNIFDLLPDRRQNIMFSATMTEEVDELIDGFFAGPVKIAIALSGTPLDNIAQSAYPAPNFYTKANLLMHLLRDKNTFEKVLVFVASKKNTDRLFNVLEETYGEEMGVVHSNKSQNYRIRSINQFDEGKNRILLTTDVMARGLDLDRISHVINFDTPTYPENYMHRIGRTGRAENEGQTILFFTPKEVAYKEAIEELMDQKIPLLEFPEEVPISTELIPEERSKAGGDKNYNRNEGKDLRGPAFHEKKDKNKKENQGGSYRRELAKKYKKPQRRGDKIQNKNSRRNKKK